MTKGWSEPAATSGGERCLGGPLMIDKRIFMGCSARLDDTHSALDERAPEHVAIGIRSCTLLELG